MGHKKVTPLKFNIDTQNRHIWKDRYILNTIIFGIYLTFQRGVKNLNTWINLYKQFEPNPAIQLGKPEIIPTAFQPPKKEHKQISWYLSRHGYYFKK